MKRQPGFHGDIAGLGLAVAAAFFLAASAWAAPSFEVRLDEPPDRAAEAVRWPVTVGVPFADGAIQKTAPISLADADGAALPVQTKALGEWRTGQKTPKWVLLDFQAEIGGGTAPLFRVAAGQEPAKGPAVRVEETGERILMDTGAAAFAVSKRKFGLIEDYALASGGKVLKESSVYWIREDGRRYETRLYPASEVVVETAGPMRAVIRAEGWYAPTDAPTERMMRYQVRIAAFAGLPYVRIHHTLIWTQDDTVAMKEFGLSFDLASPAAKGRAGLAGAEAFSADLGRLEAVQKGFQSGAVKWGPQGKPIKQLSGWAEVRGEGVGLAVGLKDMAMQVPKAFTIEPGRLHVHLWAPQAGPMKMGLYDRVARVHAEPLQKTPSYQEWANFNKVVSPQGVAKTHEIWIWPSAAGGPSAETVNDLVQRPVVAMADPVYQCSTDAFPYLRPKSATPEKYGYIEEALEAMFRHISAPIERLDDYDLWHFGDVHLFAESPWRTWDNGGYNWPVIPWMLFYRSGGREFREWGTRNAMHVMDVDCCHHGPKSAGTYQKALGHTYSYSPLHWAWGPLWDCFWTHPEYLLYCYYLTGYERAADVLTLMAEANAGGGPGNVEARARQTVSREAYGAIKPQAVYHEFLGRPTHLNGARGWAQVSLLARSPDGAFANNTFWGIPYSGLDSVYRLTSDAAIREALLKVAEPFATPPKDPANAPHWSNESMQIHAFCARESNNPAYLRYPMWRIARLARVTQTGGPAGWYGGVGYTSMARNHYPWYMEGALKCLGQWVAMGCPEFEDWPGNPASFPSQKLTPQRETFETGVTMFLLKEAGKPGTLRLAFKETNLRPFEAFADKRIEARITAPDGAVRVVPIVGRWLEISGTRFFVGPEPVRIEFPAEDAGGQYRVEALSEQPLFWLSPSTDMPGLVVHRPGARLAYEVINAPASYHLRLLPGRESLTLTDLGSRKQSVRPYAVLDADGALLRHVNMEDPASITITVPPEKREKPVTLLKGTVTYFMATPDPDGVAVRGVHDYVAVHPDQWFQPADVR